MRNPEHSDPLWGEETVAIMQLLAPIIRTEGGDVQVVAQKAEGTPFYRVLITGKNAPELHRRTAIVIKENGRDGQS